MLQAYSVGKVKKQSFLEIFSPKILYFMT